MRGWRGWRSPPPSASGRESPKEPLAKQKMPFITLPVPAYCGSLSHDGVGAMLVDMVRNSFEGHPLGVLLCPACLRRGSTLRQNTFYGPAALTD
jgi:hypothetical protein